MIYITIERGFVKEVRSDDPNQKFTVIDYDVQDDQEIKHMKKIEDSVKNTPKLKEASVWALQPYSPNIE